MNLYGGFEMKIQEIMHNIEILDSAIEQKEQQKKLIEEEKQELLVQNKIFYPLYINLIFLMLIQSVRQFQNYSRLLIKKLMFIIQLINTYLYLNMICLVNT